MSKITPKTKAKSTSKVPSTPSEKPKRSYNGANARAAKLEALTERLIALTERLVGVSVTPAQEKVTDAPAIEQEAPETDTPALTPADLWNASLEASAAVHGPKATNGKAERAKQARTALINSRQRASVRQTSVAGVVSFVLESPGMPARCWAAITGIVKAKGVEWKGTVTTPSGQEQHVCGWSLRADAPERRSWESLANSFAAAINRELSAKEQGLHVTRTDAFVRAIESCGFTVPEKKAAKGRRAA